MAQTNVVSRKASKTKTFEGASVISETPLKTLERVLNAHMLWEDTFYLEGKDAAEILKDVVHRAIGHDADGAARIIVAARRVHNIRHASLLAAVEFAKSEADNRHLVLQHVISRADELAEALSMAGAKKAPHAVMRAVRNAFEDGRFDEYQFAKYKGNNRALTLRDAVFLTHPSPKKAPLVQKIVDETLEVPNTWETRLSSGEDKGEVFTDLLKTNKLGAMALLRNLRNMDEAGVDTTLIKEALSKANWSRVLPFRFLAAAKTAPRYQKLLDDAFEVAVANSNPLPGRTAVLVDHSGSMTSNVSKDSILQLWQIGNCMASAIRGDVDLYYWGTYTVKAKSNWQRLSTALADFDPKVGYGTEVGQAINFARKNGKYDRFIVVTDMQFADRSVLALSDWEKGYTINLAPYDNPGLVTGDWTHLTGYSTATLRYIAEAEKADDR